MEVGDTVKLKSGGPLMTISWIDEYGEAYCEWFDGKEVKGARFKVTSLVKD